MLLSCPCGPSAHHCIVLTCTGQGVCHCTCLGNIITETTAPTQLTVSGRVSCHLLSPLCLSLTTDQKWKSVAQSASFCSQLSRMWGEEKKERKKERKKEEIGKMETKVVNVTEPWKAWPGVGMIRYTRFFSAVAAGINITYISPSLVQEISSPGTYNLNTLTALWFTHTHTLHRVRFKTFQVAHVSTYTHTHTHTHTRGQTRVLNSIFYSVCEHDSGCYYLFTHTHTEFSWLLLDGFVSTAIYKYSLYYQCNVWLCVCSVSFFFLSRSSLSMFMSCWRKSATWLKQSCQ